MGAPKGIAHEVLGQRVGVVAGYGSTDRDEPDSTSTLLAQKRE